MMKFACFERTVEAIYKYIVPKPRDQCTKSEQLSVTFIAGYIAGIFCAIVSHPADTIVSKLNNEKGLHLFDAVRRIGFAGNEFLKRNQNIFPVKNLIFNRFRNVERSRNTNIYDRNFNSTSMVHL